MTCVYSDIVSTALTRTSGSRLVDKNHHGAVHGFGALYEAAGALADNTVILIGKVPADATISSIKFGADDLGTTGLFNIGLYPVTVENQIAQGDTVDDTDASDEDCFATSIDVNAAAVAGQTNVLFEALNIDKINKKVWQVAGASQAPTFGEYYVAITLAQATTAAGTIVCEVQYRK